MKRIALFTLLSCSGWAFASTAGPFAPTSCVSNSVLGTVLWTTPANALDFDVNNTTATGVTASGNITDAVVELELQGSFKANQSTSAIWVGDVATPVTFPLSSIIYGGTSNLMGATSIGGWQLQRNDFSLVIAAQGVSETQELQCFWQLTNGQLDSCATVTGLQFQNYRNTTSGVKCFPKGVKVWTPQGQIPIEKLKIGHEVYSDEGGQLKVSHVIKTMQAPDPLMLDIVTEKGKITVSPEHKFFTPDGEKIIGTMKVGDFLFRRLGRDKILGIKKHHNKTMTYEVSLDHYHNYYANGFLVHNVTTHNLIVDYSSMTVTYTAGGSCQPSNAMPPSLMTLGAY